MNIDLRREQGIPIRDVPNWLPKRDGKKIHLSTVYRWISKGARGRVLESVLVGGVRYTSAEALERFLQMKTKRLILDNEVNLSEVDAALRAAGL